MMKKLFYLFRNFCREEALFSGVLLIVLLAFAPGLAAVKPLWLKCIVWYLLPAALAAGAAIFCYDVQAAAVSARGLVKSILYSAPAAVFCIVNILVGEFEVNDGVILMMLAGVTEEFLYRLMLYPAMRMHFQKSGHGEWKAVLMSSLLFGLMHLSNLAGGVGTAQVLFQCCYTTVIGLILVTGYQKSGCIWGSVIWHVLINMTGLLFV